MKKFNLNLDGRLILVVALISFLFSYMMESIKTRHQMAVDTKRLHRVISEPLDYISTIGTYLGKQIADNKKFEDLKFIDNLFKEVTHLNSASSDVISWAKFNWGDRKHRLSVSTIGGVRKTFDSLVDRNYTWRAKYEPWVLQFSKPDYGTITKTWVLPSAIGITNSRDEFMGEIIVGINIKTLINRAEAVLSSNNAFIVVNRDPFYQDADKIIFASANSPLASKSYKNFPRLVDKFRDWSDQAGSVPGAFIAGRFYYDQYRIIGDYPMVVLVGFNLIEFWSEVFYSTVKSVIFSMVFLVLLRESINRS